MNKEIQDSISDENAKFWDELCGSHLARFLGINDSSSESLERFDNWYFDFYPYLDKHIIFDSLLGKKVLEVGLGYGTISQKLAMSGAIYSGLDIAAGPVNMVNHRLLQNKLSGIAVQGSILNPPFKNEEFDSIVAIGCLHHTGDLKLALERCYNLLRPGGRLVFMVYYAYSYRRWMQMPTATLSYLLAEYMGKLGVAGSLDWRERAAYDTNLSGESAPHTDWISKKSLKKLCERYSKLEMYVENIDVIPPFTKLSRSTLLNTPLPSIIGLDLYVTATK